MRWILSLIFSVCVSATTAAQACDKAEAACILDAAWTAALVLPEDKRNQLAAPFLELAVLTDDAELVSTWETRFGQSSDIVQTYPDYGWQTAEPLLASGGVDDLITRAEQRQPPLSFGRSDVLLSAGKHYRRSDTAIALRLNQALMSLLRSASAFERPSVAHAAAELAMARCDADLLAEAIAQTDAPNNIRYAFWRARITGDGRSLLSKVRAIDSDEDTREVRRVLDGYRAILEMGYCPTVKTEIGD
jgi:hypothetical protein